MYGTVNRLQEIAQVGVEDLHLSPAAGQTEEDRLDELFTEILLAVKDFIDRDRNRDFNAEAVLNNEPVPPGLVNIALRFASNIILQLRQRQSARLVGRQGEELRFSLQQAFTPDIKRDLELYPRKSDYTGPYGMFGFSMTRLRRTNPVTGLLE